MLCELGSALSPQAHVAFPTEFGVRVGSVLSACHVPGTLCRGGDEEMCTHDPTQLSQPSTTTTLTQPAPYLSFNSLL